MDLDPECLHQVEKKYSSEEDKKVGKLYLPNKSNRLKKRSEFLNLRNKCRTFHGKFVIVNIDKSSDLTKYGLTVSKKIGNAVKRNYLKRIFRSIIRNNWKNIKKPFSFEIIPKKKILHHTFTEIEKDLKEILNK
ncbi:MAG: ribonuclease P protein component [Pelagibacteraceae bacterium TMED124]|nr:ribonuclease P protein component [Rickettsiales bacterium]RPG18412.1 MAG: ribonuclease P protein component [Pelagibacteraceae bacterium TMED124]